MIYQNIKDLVEYGVMTHLITTEDRIYTTNRLLEILHLDEYEEPDSVSTDDLEAILKGFLEFAVEKGMIDDNTTERDLFDTKIMGTLVPRPSDVINEFWDRYEISPQNATDYYYKLSCDSDYIRRYRIKRDMKWVTPTEYGDLDITINLSKPQMPAVQGK